MLNDPKPSYKVAEIFEVNNTYFHGNFCVKTPVRLLTQRLMKSLSSS